MTASKRKATAKATTATTAQPSTPIEVYRERIASVLPLECPGDRKNALAWIATTAGWLAQHYAQDRQTLAALLPPKEWRGLDGDDLWYEREQWKRFSSKISHMDNLMPILRESVKLHIPEAFTANYHRYCLPCAAKEAPVQATDAWRETARLTELKLHADKPTSGTKPDPGGKRQPWAKRLKVGAINWKDISLTVTDKGIIVTSLKTREYFFETREAIRLAGDNAEWRLLKYFQTAGAAVDSLECGKMTAYRLRKRLREAAGTDSEPLPWEDNKATRLFQVDGAGGSGYSDIEDKEPEDNDSYAAAQYENCRSRGLRTFDRDYGDQ